MLELVVAILEESLVTNPNTKIFLNHHVKDKDGFNREIDVFVETYVNNKILKYAIECKNYGNNSRIKLSDIDSFYAKISELGCKGIFVTTGKFQKNTISKAKILNIDLYVINLSEKDDIKLSMRDMVAIVYDDTFYCYVNDIPFPLEEIKTYINVNTKFRKLNVTKAHAIVKKAYIHLLNNSGRILHDNIIQGEGKVEGEQDKIRVYVWADFTPGPFWALVDNQFIEIIKFAVPVEAWYMPSQDFKPALKIYKALGSDTIFSKYFSVKSSFKGIPGEWVFINPENELEVKFVSNYGLWTLKSSIEEKE